MSWPIRIEDLSPRDQVVDALNRVLAGLDDNNVELLESGAVDDEETSFVLGEKVVKGWTYLKGYFVSKIFSLATTHSMTNIRVHFQSETSAKVTANAIAYHSKPENAFKPENQPYITGGIYFIDVVKDEKDGLWKFKRWELKLKFTQGDSQIVFG